MYGGEAAASLKIDQESNGIKICAECVWNNTERNIKFEFDISIPIQGIYYPNIITFSTESLNYSKIHTISSRKEQR